MFHTLGYLKNRVARTQEEQEDWIRLHWEWEVARRADALVAAQPLERAQLIWHYDATPSNVRVIPCGVDVAHFRPTDKAAARMALNLEERPWLLFVGRLEPIKGLDTLLQALSLIRSDERPDGGDAALLVIGGEKNGADPSEMANGLREQVRALDLVDRVFFMGSRPQVDLPMFYAASEVCVLPSRYESFGMVALESMACGTPVIASRVGGLSYTVRDGLTGFLVPEGDAESLADRIQNLLHDLNLRRQLAHNAVERARDFEWGRIATSVLDLYREICGRKAKTMTPPRDEPEALEEGSGHECGSVGRRL
jgi:D-inositol-3-phosphate glycosyltransferase